MSSSLICAPGLDYPVTFSPQERSTALLQHFAGFPALAGVTPGSRLEVRPTPVRVTTGVQELDSLTGGLPRGCLTEICGPASSGRTSVLLSSLAAATERQEACALVDTSDALDPQSALASGVDLRRLLWVRCARVSSPQRHRVAEKKKKTKFSDFDTVEQALRVLDLLLQSGGFGLVAVDFGDVPFTTARRIPLASWFRFQRAVENTPTVLLVIAQSACAQTCASTVVKLRGKASGLRPQASGVRDHASGSRSQVPEQPTALPSHTQLLEGLEIEGELLRSRLERKPVRSAGVSFATKAVRAG